MQIQAKTTMCDDQPPCTRADAAVAGVAMVLPTVLTWLYFVVLRDAPGGVQQSFYVVDKVLPFALPIAWLLLVQRRRPRWRWPGRRGWIESLASGLAAMAIIWGGYHVWAIPGGWLDGAAGIIETKLAGFNIVTPGRYLALSIFLSCGNSLLEEYYWRWFVFGHLRRILPLGVAIAAASLAFAAHHVIILGVYLGWLTPLMIGSSLAVAVAGVVWCWCYHRSDSLLGPWVSHVLADAAIFAVGYEMLLPLWTGNASP